MGCEVTDVEGKKKLVASHAPPPDKRRRGWVRVKGGHPSPRELVPKIPQPTHPPRRDSMTGGRHANMESWTPAEDAMIRHYVAHYKGCRWARMIRHFPTRTVSSLRNRHARITKQGQGANRCHRCGKLKRGHTCIPDAEAALGAARPKRSEPLVESHPTPPVSPEHTTPPTQTLESRPDLDDSPWDDARWWSLESLRDPFPDVDVRVEFPEVPAMNAEHVRLAEELGFSFM